MFFLTEGTILLLSMHVQRVTRHPVCYYITNLIASERVQHAIWDLTFRRGLNPPPSRQLRDCSPWTGRHIPADSAEPWESGWLASHEITGRVHFVCVGVASASPPIRVHDRVFSAPDKWSVCCALLSGSRSRSRSSLSLTPRADSPPCFTHCSETKEYSSQHYRSSFGRNDQVCLRCQHANNKRLSWPLNKSNFCLPAIRCSLNPITMTVLMDDLKNSYN